MVHSKRRVQITALRENQTLAAGVALAKKFNCEEFEIAEELQQPDIVLYLEYGYIGVAEIPLLLKRVRTFPSASHFLFSEADWPYPVLPGAYPSLCKPLP